MAIFKLAEIQPQSGYRLRLRYVNGEEGEVDLSGLVGLGVFKRLEDSDQFESVYVTESGDVAWSEDLELCADTLYMKVTGRSAEDVFPVIRETAFHA